MAKKSTLRLGLIGSGFMGKTHTFGFAIAARVFDLPYEIEMRTLADVSKPQAEKAASALGFIQATGDWRTLVADPNIDVVDITAPNALHKEIALAAIAAGKHVYCEKPLAPRASEAREMAEAAESAGVKTQVGFNYLCNPMIACARDMIAGGELGEVRSYRGVHAKDYMADASSPFTFRHDPVGSGALADIGSSHALATAEFLLGPISRVMGDCVTAIPERPDRKGARRAVEVDDVRTGLFALREWRDGGSRSELDRDRPKDAARLRDLWDQRRAPFSQERFNELHFYSSADAAGRTGFRRIEAGPDQPPYGQFCVAPGHQLGFNDLKAIEVAGYLDAIAGRRSEPFNFRMGLRVQTLVETIQKSSQAAGWFDVKNG